MAGIELGSGEPWMVSRWIFQRVLKEVESVHPEDPELVRALRVGEANDLLSLELVDSATRTRLREALTLATNRLMSSDAETDERFVRSVRALHGLLAASSAS